MNEKIIRLGNMNPNYNHGNQVIATRGLTICLTSAMGNGGGSFTTGNHMETKVKQIGNISTRQSGFHNPQEGRVYISHGTSPSIRVGGVE